MITGYGVSESVRHYYKIYQNTELKGKTAIIQGWGNVGAAAAFYLAQQGVKIVGIIDRVGGIIDANGLDFEQVRALFQARQNNTLVSDKLISYAEVNEKIWSLGADIFIPGAASRLVTMAQAEQMVKNGTKVIACGANVPFADPEIFFGPIGEYVDEHLSLIPDFVSNCGMARVFAYLMQPKAEMSDEAIFADTSKIIGAALEKSHAVNKNQTQIAKTCFEIALKQLV